MAGYHWDLTSYDIGKTISVNIYCMKAAGETDASGRHARRRLPNDRLKILNTEPHKIANDPDTKTAAVAQKFNQCGLRSSYKQEKTCGYTVDDIGKPRRKTFNSIADSPRRGPYSHYLNSSNPHFTTHNSEYGKQGHTKRSDGSACSAGYKEIAFPDTYLLRLME
jgi:hypothetical protein